MEGAGELAGAAKTAARGDFLQRPLVVVVGGHEPHGFIQPALHAAHKKSKKLSAVYLAAIEPALIKYNHNAAPLFRSVFQDRLFPSANVAAHA